MDPREERLGEARVRAAALASLIDLGVDVDVEDIQRAALIELSPAAVRAALNVACLTLLQWDTLAAILAGACSEERIAMFANLEPNIPRAQTWRPRRPRPTTAERDRIATEWLAGPAWTLGPEPEPSPDGGCP